MANTPITTIPTWPNAAQRLPELLRAAALALAVLLLELALAHGVVGPQISRYVFLFVGLFVVALAFRFPMATALSFFALTDFVFQPLHFAHQVGPLNVRPYEIVLVLLLALAVVKPKRRTWGGTAGIALAVFLVFVTISAALGVESGSTSLTEAFNWARPLGLLAFFYVVIRLFPSAKERRTLLTGVAVIAAVTGVVALLASVGAGFANLAQETGHVQEQAGSSVERVRLPGLSAGYAIFWFVAMQVALKRGTTRLWWLLLLAGIALDIVVSFNRNMWLGIGIGLVLIAVISGPMVRSRLTASIAVIVTGFVVFLLFGGSSAESTVEPIVERGATLISPSKTSHESSLESREQETEAAWQTYRHHPLFGVGAGAGFGVELTEPIRTGPLIVGFARAPQQFLHNQYLYLLLIAGPCGLIAFLVFLGAPLWYALRRLPRDPSLIACGVGVAMIMVSSIVAIYFTVVDMTAVLGLLTGVIVAQSGDPEEQMGPGALAPGRP